MSVRGTRSAASMETRLFVRTRFSVGRVLLIRVTLISVAVLLLLSVLWWDRGGLRDHLDNHISFRDVVYFTAVSVTTVGYGDIVPVSDRARLIDAVFVTPMRLFVWLMFLGTAYELVIQRWIERWRMERIQEKLAGHVVICGYGHSGSCAASELALRGHTVVVIDQDQKAARDAADAGYIGLHGDSTREADLAQAAVDKAEAVLICLGRDDAAVLATLTVRNLAPNVRVVCNVNAMENSKLVSQAGADATVQPSQVGGYLMADAVRTRHITDYVTDLLSSVGGIKMYERPAGPSEVGRHMREIGPDLVLRAYRAGAPVGFWEGEKSVIRTGDVLLMVRPVAAGRPSTPPG